MLNSKGVRHIPSAKAGVLYQYPKLVRQIGWAGQPFWLNRWFYLVLVFLLGLLDAATFYNNFDTVMYESWLVGVFLTIGCSIILTVGMLLFARCFHLYRYKMGGVKRWMLIVMLTAVVMFITLLFGFRWAAMDLTFGEFEQEAVFLTSIVEPAEAGLEKQDNYAAVAITLVLGFLPLLTAAISFYLGYLIEDPVKNRINKLQSEKAIIVEQRTVVAAAREQLDRQWLSELQKLDEEKLHSALDLNHKVTEFICQIARLKLAAKLGDPDAISILTDEKYSVFTDSTNFLFGEAEIYE